MMKTFLLIELFSLGLAFLSTAHAQTRRVRRDIYFFGNSFTSFHTFPNLVRQYYQQLYPDPATRPIIGVPRHAPGGAVLANHVFWMNGDEDNAPDFSEDKWSWVVIQDQSAAPAIPQWRLSSNFYADRLVAYPRNNNLPVMFYGTWGYRYGFDAEGLTYTFLEMNQALLEGYLQYIATTSRAGYQTYLAPCGLVFETIYRDCLEMGVDVQGTDCYWNTLYERDAYHPSRRGSALCSMTVAVSMTGISPYEMEFNPLGDQMFGGRLIRDIMMDAVSRTIIETFNSGLIKYPFDELWQNPGPTVSSAPSVMPSANPSSLPTTGPSVSALPSENPTTRPSSMPSDSTAPSSLPSVGPTDIPSTSPSTAPSANPSSLPSAVPTVSALPSEPPSKSPSLMPSESAAPSSLPSVGPSGTPSTSPSTAPSANPSSLPSAGPTVSALPSEPPSKSPSLMPSESAAPSSLPSVGPSGTPSSSPSGFPSLSAAPSEMASVSAGPSSSPTGSPTVSSSPSALPSTVPSGSPSKQSAGDVFPIFAEALSANTPNPSPSPSKAPTTGPSASPTNAPTVIASVHPTSSPTDSPTSGPTEMASGHPTSIASSNAPTSEPTETASKHPTSTPSNAPTSSPTHPPSQAPTVNPTDVPTQTPTTAPTQAPTENPTFSPTSPPTPPPTQALTLPPTDVPSPTPTEPPTQPPTENLTENPTGVPTGLPTPNPTHQPTHLPTDTPTNVPTPAPTKELTQDPTVTPTGVPTPNPTNEPKMKSPSEDTDSGKGSFWVGKRSSRTQTKTFMLGTDIVGDNHLASQLQQCYDEADPTEPLQLSQDYQRETGLFLHYYNTYESANMTDSSNDWVILQELPSLETKSAYSESFSPGGFMEHLIVQLGGTNTMFLMSWGYRDGTDGENGEWLGFLQHNALIEEANFRLVANARASGETVYLAPVGLAFMFLYLDCLERKINPVSEECIFSQLYAKDGISPSPVGSYLTALTITTAMTGFDPDQLSCSPKGLDEFTAFEIKDAARQAVLYSIKEKLLDYPWNSTEWALSRMTN